MTVSPRERALILKAAAGASLIFGPKLRWQSSMQFVVVASAPPAHKNEDAQTRAAY
jgi:hypothetical protein